MHPSPSPLRALLGLALLLAATHLHAQVPQIINYQGKISVGTTPFSGSGQFRFALVDGTGVTTYWSNDGSSTGGSQPSSAVALPVTNGLYVAPLGDNSVGNMPPIPASVFTNHDVRLRVWFSDGTNGSQLLSPDQRITSVGYAMSAASVPSDAISSAQLAPGSATRPKVVSTATVTAEPNQSLLLTNPAQTVVTLPSSGLATGDVIRLAASGSWRLALASGQSIVSASSLVNANSLGAAWNWTFSSSAGWYSIACSADGSRCVAGANNANTYTSSDFGVTWTARSVGGCIAVASSSSGSKLVGVGSGPVSTSTDYGATWVNRSISGSFRAVACSSDGSKIIVAGSNTLLNLSTDSGANWTQKDASRAWTGVASSADGTKLVAVANGAQIYTSSDSGATWVPRETTRAWSAVASSLDGTKLVASVQGGQIYTSTDSGVTWTSRASVQNWFSVASSADGSILSAGIANAGVGQVYTSNDSGVTWTARDSARYWTGLAMSADGTRQYASVFGQGIFTSIAGVTSFVSGGAASSLSGSLFSAVDLIYVGNNQFMLRSHEGSILAY